MPKSEKSEKSSERHAFLHDKFFKDVFKDADYVTSLIRIGAPDKLFKSINWPTLTRQSTSILAPRQPERTADLAFSAELMTGGNPAQIAIMLEHKSDFRFTSLMQQMATNLFLMHIDHQFQSPILPIVVLQTKPGDDRNKEFKPSRGTHVEFIDLFPSLPGEHRKILTKYSVNFRCLLIDVNEIERRGLARQTNIDVVIRAMSKVRGAGSWLLEEMLDPLKYVPPWDKERILGLVYGYICDYNVDEITEADLLNVRARTPEERQMILSAAEVLRQEGRVAGREQGRAEGRVAGRVEGRVEGHAEGRAEGRVEGLEEAAMNMLQDGMEPEKVAKVTKLDQSRIQMLRREANNSARR